MVNGLVDFGELLLRAHELWLKNPAVLEHYQQRWRHLLHRLTGHQGQLDAG